MVVTLQTVFFEKAFFNINDLQLIFQASQIIQRIDLATILELLSIPKYEGIEIFITKFYFVYNRFVRQFLKKHNVQFTETVKFSNNWTC